MTDFITLKNGRRVPLTRKNVKVLSGIAIDSDKREKKKRLLNEKLATISMMQKSHNILQKSHDDFIRNNPNAKRFDPKEYDEDLDPETGRFRY